MAFLAALRFLTALPLPCRPPTATELAAAPTYFPLVGLLLGMLVAGLDALLTLWLPREPASVLDLIALALLTGGLHLDGLADSCDGLFHPGTSERRLEIMRDSRTGAYGVAGLALVLLLQYAALASLGPGLRGVALIATVLLSRWSMVLALAAFPYARASGIGTPFHAGPLGRNLLLSSIIVVAACMALLGGYGLLLLAATGLLGWLAARWMAARLGGLTGDTYGALSELTQAAVLLAFAAAGAIV